MGVYRLKGVGWQGGNWRNHLTHETRNTFEA